MSCLILSALFDGNMSSLYLCHYVMHLMNGLEVKIATSLRQGHHYAGDILAVMIADRQFVQRCDSRIAV